MSHSADSAFLSSVLNLSLVPNVVFAVLDVLLALGLIVKCFTIKRHMFAHVMICMLCLIRVATYALRAVVAKSDPSSKNYGSLLIAASVLLIAGYLFFVEGIISLVIHWVLEVRHIELKRRAMIRVHYLCHLLVMLMIAPGVAGAVIQNGQISSSSPDQGAIKLGRTLRIISGAILISVVSLLVIFILTFGLVCRFTAQRNSGRPSLLTTCVLMFLGCCAVIEAVYRCWSGATYTGFIVMEAAVGVFVFLPESLVFITFVVVNLDDLSELDWSWRR